MINLSQKLKRNKRKGGDLILAEQCIKHLTDCCMALKLLACYPETVHLDRLQRNAAKGFKTIGSKLDFCNVLGFTTYLCWDGAGHWISLLKYFPFFLN